MALTVAQLVARLTADTSGFYRGMALANSSMIRTGGIVARVAAGAGLAVTGMGILALRTAGNFEQSMNVLQAVSGATEQQFKGLHDEAIALGRDMKLPNVSAKDAAEAMTELSKAGLSVRDIMAATRGTLQFGIAANIGFADSANIVARSLTAFGLSGSHAVQVADLFTAAANKSTASAQDIALGFQMASAQFKAGDQTIQGLTTSLALMANAGIVGSDAGTSLKTMMNRLMAPTKKAAGLMDDLGIDVYDASGNMKSMPNIIQELTSSMAGMSKEQRNAALYTIFGSDAIRAARVQMDAGAKGWQEMEKRITKGGEAQAFAEARTKGFNGAVQALFSAVETLAIELGEHMLPYAEKAARAMANFVNSVNADKIAAFFGAIFNGIGAFISFVRETEAAQYVLAGLAGALVGLFVAQKLIAMFKAIQIAWMALNASFALSPIGLLVIGIGALVAALVLAYMKVEWFREAVDGAFSWMRDNVLPIMESIVTGIRDHWESIKAIFRIATANIRLFYEQFVMRLVNFTRDHWEEISAVIRAVLNNILIMVRGVLTTIQGVVNLVMGIIRGDWSRAWEGIKQILSGTLGAMAALVKNILTSLVPAVLNLALAIGKAIITGIGNGLANLTSWVLDKIRSGISSAITSVVGWVGDAASAVGRAIVDGIISGVGSLVGRLKDAIGGAIGGVLSHVNIPGFSPPEEAAKKAIGIPLADGVILGWLLGTRDLPEKMSESLRKALEKGKATVDEYMSRYKDAFGRLASEALLAFDRMTDAHMTRSEKLLDKLVSEHDKEEFKRRMREARDALAQAQSELASFDPTKFESPEEAEAARKELEQKVLDAQREFDELKYQQKRMALERQAAKEREDYEERRRRQRLHLERELEQLIANLAKHPLEHKKNQEKILALLRKYGVDYHEVGSVLGREFAQGMIDSLPDVEDAARRLADRVKAILKLKSPAKEGPMKDLDTWWKPFGSTLVSGLDMRPIERAALAMAGIPYTSMGPGYALGRSATTTGVGSPIYVNVQVHGSLIAEQDLNDRIREAIVVEERRGRTV